MPLPTLAQRLTRRTPRDPCANAARGARGATYTCKDPSAPELLVIPAATPFAITRKPYTAKTIEQWHSRNPPAGDSAALDDLAKADRMADWISQRTDRRYRRATVPELREASSYGAIVEGIPLVREIDLPVDTGEAEALERWWQRHHRPGP